MNQPSRVRWIAVAVAGALALAGCATMQVGTYATRGLDLRQYRIYAWGPSESLSTGDPRLDNNEFFDARVRMQVDRQLATRGFEKNASASPDLLVHYHASVSQQIDVRNLDPEYGYCDDEDCGPYVYDAGTLFVDLIDARTNTLLWRGWAEGSMDRAIDNQAWMEETIDEAVGRILQRLPAGL